MQVKLKKMKNLNLPVWSASHENSYDKNGVNFPNLTFAEAWEMCQGKNLYPGTRGFIISPEGKNVTLGDGRTPEIEEEATRLRMLAIQPAL